ncbi:hypothetical protein B0J13DRAFT_506734 [Dactylonectria estremocensis]|uniref:Zn(2)-C6 fungal-type domain-containing protein n=1 Tax=Dactylonectria estremocensis TaxID=1079267 RepID=A0A9P9IVD8_9HYPO|nr:hypothetical protein B0J13DRAFT_506734 [Dactylonectria estremocensis]
MVTPKVERSKRRRYSRACENCRRRKVRCDGLQPCLPCLQRRQDCQVQKRFMAVEPPSNGEHEITSSSKLKQKPSKINPQQESPVPPTGSLHLPCSLLQTPTEIVQSHKIASKTVARLPLLQALIAIIDTKLGHCDFWDNSLFNDTVQAPDVGPTPVLITIAPPPKPCLQEARYLLEWYKLSANRTLGFMNLRELDKGLVPWLQDPMETADATTAIYYLMFAVGAQSCPEDKDETAEKYFNYGKYVTMSTLWDSGIPTIQSHLLATTYLLAASRTDTALMHLRVAIESGISSNLHKPEPRLRQPSGFEAQDSLWRAIRVLDLFTATLLDQSPLTIEISGEIAMKSLNGPSDLYSLFAMALSEIRNETLTPSKALQLTVDLRNCWIFQAKATDYERANNKLEGATDDISNINFVHLKGTYYRTVMLLSQPFLLEMVSSSHPWARTTSHAKGDCEARGTVEILASLCLESAVREIHLLKVFLSNRRTPKRLPYLVNSVFISALTLCLALFGDLGRHFPLQFNLQDAQSILRVFSKHDNLTRRYLSVLDRFQSAYATYISVKTNQRGEQGACQIGSFYSDQDQALPQTHESAANRKVRTSALESPSSDLIYCPGDTTSSFQSACGLNWPSYEMIGDYGDLSGPDAEGLGLVKSWLAIGG